MVPILLCMRRTRARLFQPAAAFTLASFKSFATILLPGSKLAANSSLLDTCSNMRTSFAVTIVCSPFYSTNTTGRELSWLLNTLFFLYDHLLSLMHGA